MEKKASVGKIHMTAKERNDRMFAGALLLPSVLITVIFILIPVADSVVKSFLSYKVKNIISGTPGEWNNFANYIKLFQNGKLGMAIVHTLLFVTAVVVAQFLLGMALALILNADIRFSRFVRSIMMAPWVVPTIISGLIWMQLYQPQYGLLKYLISLCTGGNVTDTELIVASIVQMETRSPEHMSMIAGIIYNRLEQGMQLQMDSTREYINDYVTGNPLLGNTSKYAELYNTYKCAALPAGPICSPGADAINAAKNPTQTDYLYFFFGNDNENHYSATYEEHQAAMAQFGVQYGESTE